MLRVINVIRIYGLCLIRVIQLSWCWQAYSSRTPEVHSYISTVVKLINQIFRTGVCVKKLGDIGALFDVFVLLPPVLMAIMSATSLLKQIFCKVIVCFP